MSIQKQEFYEGAALLHLVTSGFVERLRYEAPFFVANERAWLYLKYCTRNRTPWGFTFGQSEREMLQQRSLTNKDLFLGLVCGSDGVAAVSFTDYCAAAGTDDGAIRISCARRRGEHYAVSGPAGDLPSKVPPIAWRRLLSEAHNEPLQ